MAPSAVETVTTEQIEVPVLKLHSTQSGTGDYKQLQPHGFDKEAEEGKLEGFERAKVRIIILQDGFFFFFPFPFDLSAISACRE